MKQTKALGIAISAVVTVALAGCGAMPFKPASAPDKAAGKGPPSMLAEVDGAAAFDKEVSKHPGVVVVDFWGPGCPACERIAPQVEQVASESKGKAKFVKVNVWAPENRFASKFGFNAIPHFIVFKDGKKVGESGGGNLDFRAFVQSHLD